MLSKEVKDILEGVHFFLTDGLKNENLSGKVECLRKGLLLQLEAMRATYPLLSFPLTESNANNLRNTSASLPYLNVDQQNISSRMSTSSSSTNYSSTGGSNGSSTWYSGDGIITGLNHNTIQDKKSENEEEFEEIDTPSQTIFSNRKISISSENKKNEEKDDDSYAEGIEPVSFRLLLGTCTHHGDLRKRSKGILTGMRNSKAFKGVLSGTLLYLYCKESDDKQKKAIDLTGYQVEETIMDENKLNSRRRDFAFQLVAHRKKTHVFCTSKSASTARWINFLQQAIASAEHPQGAPPSRRTLLTKVEEYSRRDLTSDTEDGDEDDDDDEEFYEELNPEEVAEVGEDPNEEHPNLWKPPLLPYQTTPLKQSSDDVSDYYSVPDEERASPSDTKHTYYNEQKPRVPPERPPLPAFLRERELNRTRPLPEAPNKGPVRDVDRESPAKLSDDEIYCEIDEDLASTLATEDFRDDFPESMNDLFTDTNSLSKEIFDTINERVPTLPERAQNGRKWTDMSFRSNNSSSTDTETYDVPNDVRQVSQKSGVTPPWKKKFSGVAAPSLPPRGATSSLNSSDEESEYKVPSYTYNTESLYQYPSSIPIPVNVDNVPINVNNQHSTNNQQISEDLSHHSDNAPSNSDTDKVSLDEKVEGNADNIVVIHANNADSKNIEHASDSLNNNNKNNSDNKNKEFAINCDLNCDDKSASNSPNLMENVSGETETKTINSSNSVKDLIAKLNQFEGGVQGSETSQFTQPNIIRRSKHSFDSVERSLLVENKNKIEVSRTVQSIKNELETKERLQLDVKDIKNASVKDIKGGSVKDIKDESVKDIRDIFSVKDIKNFISVKDIKNVISKCNERPIEMEKERVDCVNRIENDSLSQCSERKPSKEFAGSRENSGVFIAKFAYVARTSGELSFSRGDEVLVQHSPHDEKQWHCVVKGRQGLVPKEYLRKKKDVW